MRKGALRKFAAAFVVAVMILNAFSVLALAAPSGGTGEAAIGSAEYSALADAVAAASDGDTIVLQKDVCAEDIIAIPDNINLTLDFNGFTMTASEDFNRNSGEWGVFNVGENAGLKLVNASIDMASYYFVGTNKGSVVASAADGESIICNELVDYNYGSVTVNGGSYIVEYALVYDNYGTVEINDSEVVSDCYIVGYIYEAGYVEINGGTYTSKDEIIFGMETDEDKVTINGGTFTITGNDGFCSDLPGKIILNDVTINAKYRALCLYEGCHVEINGGTYTGSDPEYGGAAVYLSGSADLTISEGIFVGPDGYPAFNSDDPSYFGGITIPSGSACIPADGITAGAQQVIIGECLTYKLDGADSVLLSDIFAACGASYDASDCSSIDVSNTVAVSASRDGSNWVIQKNASFGENLLTLTTTEGTIYLLLRGEFMPDTVAVIGDDEYNTVEGAVNAAADGDTVILVRDAEVSTAMILDGARSITMDFNGYTLSAPDCSVFETIGAGCGLTLKNADVKNEEWYFCDQNYGSVTVENTAGDGMVTEELVDNNKGTVTVKDGNFDLYYGIVWDNYGDITIENANIIVANSSIIEYAHSGSSIIINNGVYTAPETIIYSIESGSTVTINGGKYTASGYYGYCFDEIYGRLDIKNAEFYALESVLQVGSGGVVNIQSGSFNGGDGKAALYAYDGSSVTLSGGTFTGGTDGKAIDGTLSCVVIKNSYHADPADWAETGANVVKILPDIIELVFIADGEETDRVSVTYNSTAPRWPQTPEAPEGNYLWWGWVDADGNRYAADTVFSEINSAELILTASWIEDTDEEPDPVQINAAVTWVCDGASTKEIKSVGTKLSAFSGFTSCDGRTGFTGWQKEDGSLAAADDVINSDITLTAVFAPAEKYTVTFMKNGVTAGTAENVAAGTSFGSLEGFECSDAGFVGWMDEATNAMVSAGDAVEKDTVLNAKYPSKIVNSFEELQEALDAKLPEIQLGADIEVSGLIEVKYDLLLLGDGHGLIRPDTYFGILLQVDEGAALIADDLLIDGRNVEGTDMYEAVHVQPGADLTMNNCTVQNNLEDGIYCPNIYMSKAETSTIKLYRSRFIDNNGAGVNIDNNNSIVSVDRCTFTGNHNSGIRSNGIETDIVDCIITNNSVDEQKLLSPNYGGGGVRLRGKYAVIRGNTLISNNYSCYCGGGVYFACDGEINDNVEICYNHSENDGGGVWIDGDIFMNDNFSIHHNSCERNGGGIGFTCQYTLTVTGGKIFSNHADGYGGGVEISYPTDPQYFKAGMVYGNDAGLWGDDISTEKYHLAEMYATQDPRTYVPGEKDNSFIFDLIEGYEPKEGTSFDVPYDGWYIDAMMNHSSNTPNDRYSREEGIKICPENNNMYLLAADNGGVDDVYGIKSIWSGFCVVLDANNGSGDYEYVLKAFAPGEEYETPSCMFTNDGCRFVGWNTQADGSGQWLYPQIEGRSTLTVNANRVLYAQWEKVYTLSYSVAGDANYGIPADSVVPENVSGLRAGRLVVLNAQPETEWNTSTGKDDSGIPGTWTFAPEEGWSETSGDYTKFTDTVSQITADTTVYGKWTFTPDTYAVTYTVESDETWGLPDDSVTPADNSRHPYGDVVTPQALTSVQGTAKDENGNDVPGTWSFSWKKTSYTITGDTEIVGTWTFTPDEAGGGDEEPDRPSPKAGDPYDIALWVSLTAISAAGVLVGMIERKKKVTR